MVDYSPENLTAAARVQADQLAVVARQLQQLAADPALTPGWIRSVTGNADQAATQALAALGSRIESNVVPALRANTFDDKRVATEIVTAVREMARYLTPDEEPVLLNGPSRAGLSVPNAVTGREVEVASGRRDQSLRAALNDLLGTYQEHFLIAGDTADTRAGNNFDVLPNFHRLTDTRRLRNFASEVAALADAFANTDIGRSRIDVRDVLRTATGAPQTNDVVVYTGSKSELAGMQFAVSDPHNEAGSPESDGPTVKLVQLTAGPGFGCFQSVPAQDATVIGRLPLHLNTFQTMQGLPHHGLTQADNESIDRWIGRFDDPISGGGRSTSSVAYVNAQKLAVAISVNNQINGGLTGGDYRSVAGYPNRTSALLSLKSYVDDSAAKIEMGLRQERNWAVVSDMSDALRDPRVALDEPGVTPEQMSLRRTLDEIASVGPVKFVESNGLSSAAPQLG